MKAANFKVVFNKQRVSYKGLSSLYIRIRIGEQKKEIPLQIRWPTDKFDHENGLCRQRFPGDQEADDNNMIIRGQIARINDIFTHYRLARMPITMTKLANDLKYDYSKTDFITYMEKKIKIRLREKEIIQPTYINHMKAVNKLKAAYTEVLFADFDENWSQKFDNYLRRTMTTKLNDNQNARWSIHKVVKTYIKQAQKDGILFVNPYEYFRIRPGAGSWRALFEPDIKRLYKYYHARQISWTHKRVLRCFLFSCMTGLRISDLLRVKASWVEHEIMSFIPYKGRKKNRRIEIPLNKIALELFKDSLADHPDPDAWLFYDVEEQYANNVLKEIGSKCKIKTRLHHHVGRHTFITTFYNRTKDLVAAQAFAGHENISATMIYTHNDPKAAKEKMKAMDEII